MSTEVSKQEYLKRYLEGDKSKHKKKSRSKSVKVSRLKIIDQDIDIKSIGVGDKDVDELDDEEPVIAEVIDERPLEVKLKELYESSRWKKVSSDGNSLSESAVFHDEDKRPDHSPLYQTKNDKKARHDSDSDISPPRHNITSSNHPLNNSSSVRPRCDSDSDLSPPRSKTGTKRHNSPDRRRSSQKRRLDRHDSDCDVSPPNRSNDKSHCKESNPPVKQRHDSGSDLSPPRRKTAKTRHDSGTDPSPSKHTSDIRSSRKDRNRGQGSDSDLSPPRKSSSVHVINSRRPSSHAKQRQNSDSDLSPPRLYAKKDPREESRDNRPQKTLTGLKAGLQDSDTLRREVEGLKRREKSQLNMMDESVSGRNAETVVRDRKTGLRRDLEQEQRDKDEEIKRNEEHQKKYMEWGKGVVQKQSQMEKVSDDLYEMTKPLARYEDDEDLDAQLKAMIHDEDPMSAYIRKKKGKDKPSLPVYNGPPPPPNRFNIAPGYRWDGVDRSNGFEKKYFEKINSNKASREQSYLWSIQDM